MSVQFILLALAAYLLGSVPTAYLIARWRRGIDIRQYGSGNVGAANVLAVVSKRWGIPVTVVDVGKGALPVGIAQIMGFGGAEQIAVGIFAVIGHNWPIFLSFRGGRGVLTTLGVVTMLSWRLGLIGVVLSYALAPIRQLALGVFLALVSFPLLSWFLSQPLGIEARLPVTVGLAVLALIGVAKRLLAPRTALSASVPLAELMVNRLLFDRDIRDREAWIRQSRPVEEPFEEEERQEKSFR